MSDLMCALSPSKRMNSAKIGSGGGWRLYFKGLVRLAVSKCSVSFDFFSLNFSDKPQMKIDLFSLALHDFPLTSTVWWGRERFALHDFPLTSTVWWGRDRFYHVTKFTIIKYFPENISCRTLWTLNYCKNYCCGQNKIFCAIAPRSVSLL